MKKHGIILLKQTIWTIPVSSETIELAKNGIWDVVATPTKPVLKSWFPKDFNNIKVLCLAGGGGQQGPIFAALGADVTYLTTVENSLKKMNL